jgi:hypothetical protein
VVEEGNSCRETIFEPVTICFTIGFLEQSLESVIFTIL